MKVVLTISWSSPSSISSALKRFLGSIVNCLFKGSLLTLPLRFKNLRGTELDVKYFVLLLGGSFCSWFQPAGSGRRQHLIRKGLWHPVEASTISYLWRCGQSDWQCFHLDISNSVCECLCLTYLERQSGNIKHWVAGVKKSISFIFCPYIAFK